MSKKLFTKVVSLSLAAAMVLSMAPVGASAAKKKKAKEVKPKTMKLTSKSKASKIKVGETKTIVATRKQKKTTAKVKYVKFTPKKTKNIGIKVTTSDDAVVSVEELSKGKYTYTGVTAGTATLTITSRAKTAKKKTLKAKLAVTVISPFRVTQTGSHTFTMSTADKLEKAPEKKDIMVRQAESEVDNAIKDVKLSADKMAVEVTMHVPFRDQQKYEVTFGKEKDSFVASVGVPDTIEIKTKTVVINKPTEVEYAIYDKNRMDVTKTLDENKITVSVDAKSGYYDTKKKELTLYRVGDKAEATVIYDTWTFDEKGNKNAITGKGTIEAVARDAVTVTGLEKYTIAETVLDWGTDEMVHKMPQGKTKHIFVKMRKSDDSWVDNLGKEKNNFKFSHTDASVVTVDEDGNIYGFRQGTAYVKVVYTEYNIKYEYTLPVEVGPASSPAVISLSPEYVTIQKNTPAETVVVAQVKDQYGEILNVSEEQFTVEHLNGADVADIKVKALKSTKAMSLEVRGEPKNKTGVGSYRVKYGNSLNIVLTVNAIEVNANAPITYVLKPVSETKFDSSVSKYTTNDDLKEMVNDNLIQFKIYETKANVITGDAKGVIAANQKHEKNERVTSVSISAGSAVRDNKDDDSKFIAAEPSSDIITVNEDGNLITIKPVLMEGDNVLLTHKDGTYTLKVIFWVKDKDNPGKFNKVILTQQYTIENKTKEGVQGSENDYEIEKTVKLSPEHRTAEFMAKAIVRPTGGAVIPNGQWTKDYFYTVSRGIGKWDNTFLLSSPKEKAREMDYNMLYNLDKAPIPTFKTEEGKQIWTLKDHIARDVKLIADSVITSITLEPTNVEKQTKVSFVDKEWNKLGTEKKVYYTLKKEELKKEFKIGEKLTAADWTVCTNPINIDNVENNQEIRFVLTDKAGKFLADIATKNAVVKAKVTSIEYQKDGDKFVDNMVGFFNGAKGERDKAGIDNLSVTVKGEQLEKLALDRADSWELSGIHAANYKVAKVEKVKLGKKEGNKGVTTADVELYIGVADGQTVATGEETVNLKLKASDKTLDSIVEVLPILDSVEAIKGESKITATLAAAIPDGFESYYTSSNDDETGLSLWGLEIAGLVDSSVKYANKITKVVVNENKIDIELTLESALPEKNIKIKLTHKDQDNVNTMKYVEKEFAPKLTKDDLPVTLAIDNEKKKITISTTAEFESVSFNNTPHITISGKNATLDDNTPLSKTKSVELSFDAAIDDAGNATANFKAAKSNDYAETKFAITIEVKNDTGIKVTTPAKVEVTP